MKNLKTPSPTRIYHPWWKWECFKAGFYESSPPEGVTPEQAELMYKDFLSNLNDFAAGMELVMSEWPHSCEQFLTNPSFNRIAWLGQTAMCVATGVPGCFRSGFKLLTPEQQDAANNLADKYLEMWLEKQCTQLKKIGEYIEKWKSHGYPDDIPDEVPTPLMNRNLAPSYKAIALALLKNDHNFESLGFSPKKSYWYSAFKRVEIEERARVKALATKT